MDGTDALLLARIQFAVNIGFHILFVSITLALAWILVYFRVQYARTRKARWLNSFNLWARVFALTFAVGVVTGVVMSFQFGTNWPGFMENVGNVAGPLLAYEVLTAFFLEAAFLGIMLFGMNRVPGWAHITATVLVAVGTSLSAFWILALNSWMQTPVAFDYDGDDLIAAGWWDVLFNPSLPVRLVHMLLASGVTAAFVIAGLSALRLLKAPKDKAAYVTWRTGAMLAAFLTPAQLVVGDLHGANTYEYQPAKIAAMEAIWETHSGVDFIVFAIPNEDERRNDYALRIPRLTSLLLEWDADAEIRGLDAFEPDTPPIRPVFYAFRVMVGLGLVMIVLSWLGVWKTWGGVQPSRRLLWVFAAFTFAGWVATVAGWMVTEIGRQPWLVTGVLRTADAVGPVGSGALGASLTAYSLIYALLLISYLVVITHLARRGGRRVRPLREERRVPVK